jgi:hypothetical protein
LKTNDLTKLQQPLFHRLAAHSFKIHKGDRHCSQSKYSLLARVNLLAKLGATGKGKEQEHLLRQLRLWPVSDLACAHGNCCVEYRSTPLL